MLAPRSNLCVDIVVPMDELPPADTESRHALLQLLTAQPPPVEQWEVGGNTNFLIAASRLGLRTASVGHLVSCCFPGRGLCHQRRLAWAGRRSGGTWSAVQSLPVRCALLDTPSIPCFVACRCCFLACSRAQLSSPPLAARRSQGRDIYGAYMRDVLAAEGVRQVEPVADGELAPEVDQTLLCFVLVAPDGTHAFCRWGTRLWGARLCACGAGQA